MERRDFLQQIAAVMAAGMAGSQLGACQHTAGSTKGAVGSGGGWDAQIFLQRLKMLDEQLTRKVQFTHKKDLRTLQREALFRQSLSTLLFVGSLHDLSPEARKHPAIQKHILAAMPVLEDTVYKMATYVEGISKSSRKGVQTLLKEKQADFSRFQRDFLQKGKELGIPLTRLNHMNRLLDQVLWQMRRQNPSLLLDKLVGKVDRVASKAGVDTKARRKQGALSLHAVGACSRFGDDGLQDPPPRRGIAGGIILGIGAAAVGGGILASVFGGGEGVILGGIFGWTPGAILMIVGLILLALGK